MSALYSKRDVGREREIKSPPGVKPEPYRSAYRRDYARLIHSAAFRRLQGKTQLFPGLESDFFRNRLTHSLEVAQIAKSIAIRLNDSVPKFQKNPIDCDLVEIAGLAHDLGHPPFGHNGEAALDDCMKQFGGFEGNAQTLRILAKLEKRELKEGYSSPLSDDGEECRLGLNLTYRALAAILKYDHEIPLVRKRADRLVKGYYHSERDLVRKVKSNVLRGENLKSKTFKTIECQIMDLADDIAYSTYDLEDAFKAGFTSPLHMLSADDRILSGVATEVGRALAKYGNGKPRLFTAAEVRKILFEIFGSKLGLDSDQQPDVWKIPSTLFLSEKLSSNGYLRTALTSGMVREFITSVESEIATPLSLSKVYLPQTVLERVEVLKHFTFKSLIMSPRLKVAEHRGYDIVRTIFEELASEKEGYLLLPDDCREIYERATDELTKRRVICDFVAGMTDRYAVEFYGRLRSENAQSIFKPI